MKKTLLKTLLVVGVLLAVWLIPFPSKKGEVPKEEEQATVILTPAEQWKAHLKSEIEKAGLSEKDYVILYEIIFCESSWRQYWENGSVIVVNGNRGLAQINKTAHQVEYTELQLNPDDPFQNITYAVILYKRNGIRDWEKWSGRCFIPRLAKLGIYF